MNVTNPAATTELDPGKTLEDKTAATVSRTAAQAVETNLAGTVTVIDTLQPTTTMFNTSTPDKNAALTLVSLRRQPNRRIPSN